MVVAAAVTASAKTTTTKFLKMPIHPNLHNEMPYVFSGRSLGRQGEEWLTKRWTNLTVPGFIFYFVR